LAAKIYDFHALSSMKRKQGCLRICWIRHPDSPHIHRMERPLRRDWAELESFQSPLAAEIQEPLVRFGYAWDVITAPCLNQQDADIGFSASRRATKNRKTGSETMKS